ncbi:MAG: cytochrome c [Pseudomonadota bacterium]
MRLSLLLTLMLAGTASAQDSSWVDLEKTSGAELFGEKCGMCHRAGGMGTTILGRRLQGDQALLENRADLKAEFIDVAVRSGFGVMYPISRGEVSDEQLAKIKQHLVKTEAK